MFWISSNLLDATFLYNTYGNIGSYGISIRPVVEIDLSKVNVGLTGDGGAATPYSIEAK